MSIPAITITCILLAYLAGSLPFGLLLGKLVFGRDIRKDGSGNIGATNVARVFGMRWGLVVLALDALKGLLPVAFLPRLIFSESHPAFIHVQVACGIATVVGHMFPCWLGFRGGKGVATALGVILVLAPWATLAAFLTFAAVLLAFRFMSLASMLAALVFAATELWLLTPDPFAEPTWSRAAFSLLVPALIVLRHRANIARLLRGEEPRFRSKRVADS
ncbi:MAG: glycerol-3-phosphate 1-O-acyltransferase PlsY [Planctomycetaceae bacterium]